MLVHTFESPNFLPSPQNRQVHLLKSITYNLLRFHKYLHSVFYINRMIRETEAEVVVNFYELLSGVTYLCCRPQAKMICIAHQYLFLHPDFKFPDIHPLSVASLKFFTRLTALGAAKKLTLSFRKMREHPKQTLIAVPPLLRKEVLECESADNGYLHGYILNSGYFQEIYDWHKDNPAVKLHFFWDKKEAEPVTEITPNLHFHQLDDISFIQYMAGASAYATTAGFESVCEAMYLNKPVLMVPVHIEQACNAFDACRIGAGIIGSRFELNKLRELAEKKINHQDFRHWVKQADWLIAREFREDLVFEENPQPFLRRVFTNWVYKMGRSLPV
ncbi:MAG: glycosyltransferase [Tannerellaceae bacterium]|nr:glycosyltransferase [Tannerellaceae bacterium]MCD8263736.1 glycosyltransferase [Tannerellaceae bacterium]